MPFGIGNSKSKSSDDDVAFNNVDYRQESGAFSGNTNYNTATSGKKNTVTNNITTTDHQAVERSFGLASQSLDNMTTLTDNIKDLAELSVTNSASLAQSVARSDGEVSSDSTVKLLGIILIGGAALLYVYKKAK